jgi:hypothetical protein
LQEYLASGTRFRIPHATVWTDPDYDQNCSAQLRYITKRVNYIGLCVNRIAPPYAILSNCYALAPLEQERNVRICLVLRRKTLWLSEGVVNMAPHPQWEWHDS